MERKRLRVIMAVPRGFCAGVDRAIRIVEGALARYGAPVYVRHEIVHNRTVVEDLEAKGAVFVEELDEVPEGAQVIFSAHGVPKSVPIEAQRRNLTYLDATCPLVSKVHKEAERHHAAERHILLIGHEGHPEVVGTMGQLPQGVVTLINNVEEAKSIKVKDESNLAYITQTTLSIDDTADIVETLKVRFPSIVGPSQQDICYATTNRQHAIKEFAKKCDLVIVIGAHNSSNSLRLKEVAERAGAKKSILIPTVAGLDYSIFNDVETVGISAGASAPESVVQELLANLKEHFDIEMEESVYKEENITFRLPLALSQ